MIQVLLSEKLITMKVLNLSKLLTYQQLYDHFDSVLSPKQCGIRKGYSVRYCFMVILETFRESRGRGDEFGALFTDLSKAFDYIDRNLLITNLSWYEGNN